MRVTRIAITTAALLLSASSVIAQDRRPIPPDEESKYVVSAKAGVVSFVEGKATATSKTALAMPERMLAGDELRMDDTIKTDPGARVEILLNPGCYLRLGENSELVFLFDGIDMNQIKLLRGSAVIEASAVDDLIVVETPRAQFKIARDGLYRFNVDPDGRSEVAVRKGRVLVGNSTIKDGKIASAEGDTAAVASLNKKLTDELDNWSKERARTLIAANRQLSNSLMRRSLGMSFLANAWVFDPFCRCYTFLPYTGGFSSPYGWSYPVCNPYWYRAYNRWNGGGSLGGYPHGGSGGGSSSGGGSTAGGGGSRGGGSVGGGGGTHASPPSTPPPSSPRGGGREQMPPRRP
ncbi:MAG TPA: FecR family protein [Blastocatellia bacterium]|nr:FecR family protein [Blastocatellia bacterium]